LVPPTETAFLKIASGCFEAAFLNHSLPKGSKDLFMALPVEDLQALGNLSDARHKAEDTTP